MGSGGSKEASDGGRAQRGRGRVKGGRLSLLTSSCFGDHHHHNHNQSEVEDEEEESAAAAANGGIIMRRRRRRIRRISSSRSDSCMKSNAKQGVEVGVDNKSGSGILSLAQNNKFPLPSSDSSHTQQQHEHEEEEEEEEDDNTSANSRIQSSSRLPPFRRINGLSLLGRAASLGSSSSSSAAHSLHALGYHNSNTNESQPNNNNDLLVLGNNGHASQSQTESFGTTRVSSRRPLPHQQHLEGSIRFSRTLSVGRLRDRVLRRTSYADGLFAPPSLEYHPGRPTAAATPSSSSDNSRLASSSMDGNHSYNSDASRYGEATNRDLLEHRSAFLERRRRIRSQVRALQRLGSRFEDSSGHDRSCILSGQHRTGRCMCRTSNGAINADEDTSTRTSISRIVMLAEALFEVLDEIHHQSVALSSRPSFSSIGSIPAPKEVVECMPMKVFVKSQRNQNEESAQCYICLVEYEEGDCIRVLPCHHEFHQMCIDKWLKEIHRVCPLCRGDVCRSEFASVEKV